MNWYKTSQQVQPALQQAQPEAAQRSSIDPGHYIMIRDQWQAEMQQMIDTFVNRRDEFDNNDIHNHLNAIAELNNRYFRSMEDWMRSGGIQV